ncbi:TetR/AcrR family transcriptional regulator [Sporosarcina cascadiensis]|uniref:TetR/AcrR family transcriptional regulator n=1 Tax=Sporosarcina cascadiensis TaxID=2660747 RepID=UPI00129B3FCC|nr:TetR/AcrR family transcriptional regulator [Sporosarcina cascadiensis]
MIDLTKLKEKSIHHEEKKQFNKRRRFDPAVHLFSQKPFSVVSMRDIAKEAEVSSTLFYKYFDDQQRLYIEAMKIEAQTMMICISTIHELSELVEYYIRHMFNEEVLYQMMAYFMLESAGKRAALPANQEISKLIGHFEFVLLPLYSVEAKRESQLLFSTLKELLITYKNHLSFSNEQALQHILSLTERYLDHLKTAE